MRIKLFNQLWERCQVLLLTHESKAMNSRCLATSVYFRVGSLSLLGGTGGRVHPRHQ